jgi:hypothetical protein
LKKEGKLRMVGRRVDAEASLQLHQERLAAQQRSPARQVKDVYDARMAKLEYERAVAKVVDASTVQREWRQALLRVKNRFLGLGRELAPLLHGRGPLETKTIIDRRIFEILRLLAHPEHYPEEQLVKDCNLSTNKEAT